ncbi:MAG: DUF4276 family protein [Dehalococcoidia bacterium]|nr:DUF4276 family protein [Dehalococcoidia bacterium]
MSLGLYVEGRSDKDTIPILIRKLGYRSRVITKDLGGQSELLVVDKMARHLAELLREHSDVELVLICCDALEGVGPSTTERRLSSLERRLNLDFPIPVRYAVVDHALEGWLGCDEEALRAVLGGPRARINIRANPEHHPTPTDLLERVFRDNGRRFRKTRDNSRIAERVSPERIAAQSPTFRRFAEILGHPVLG